MNVVVAQRVFAAQQSRRRVAVVGVLAVLLAGACRSRAFNAPGSQSSAGSSSDSEGRGSPNTGEAVASYSDSSVAGAPNRPGSGAGGADPRLASALTSAVRRGSLGREGAWVFRIEDASAPLGLAGRWAYWPLDAESPSLQAAAADAARRAGRATTSRTRVLSVARVPLSGADAAPAREGAMSTVAWASSLVNSRDSSDSPDSPDRRGGARAARPPSAQLLDLDTYSDDSRERIVVARVPLADSSRPVLLAELAIPEVQGAELEDLLAPMGSAWTWLSALGEFLHAPDEAFIAADGRPSRRALARLTGVEAMGRAAIVDASAWEAFARGAQGKAALTRLACASADTCAQALARYLQEADARVAFPFVWKKAAASDVALVGAALGLWSSDSGRPEPQADVELWDDVERAFMADPRRLARARSLVALGRAANARVLSALAASLR